MAKTFDRPITIQKIDEITEEWVDLYNLHASINKSKTDSEYLKAGAIQAKRSLTFEVRYFKELEDISYNTQLYRIVYQGVVFNIVDFDDFKLLHKTAKLSGVA